MIAGLGSRLPAPQEQRRRWPRAAVGTAATVSFGFGVLGLLFLLVGGIGPSDRGLWIALVILFALAAVGRPLRGDVPGHRETHRERERRGF
jgi:hypothetical protein